MFYVTLWDSSKVVCPCASLTKAKRVARSLGSVPADPRFFTGDAPVAYVSNDRGECVYNPRFRHEPERED